jgi:uncharacterized protein
MFKNILLCLFVIIINVLGIEAHCNSEPVLNRPQEPKPPFSYYEEDVSYQNEKSGFTLAGTLTFPKSEGLFPCVVLISGSGSHDRNENIFGHKPFFVLADALTRRGIAVLRVDDRGVGGSTGSPEFATSLDFADDVVASVQYLKSRKEVNDQQIGLVGHSEGGMIAPLVALEDKDVAFLVLMAAPGIKGEEILYAQGKKIIQLMDLPQDVAENEISLQKALLSILKTEDDYEKSKYFLIKAMEESRGRELVPQEIAAISSMNSPWYRYFIYHDSSKVLEKIKIPVLAINGSLDCQVLPEQNLQAIERALKQASNQDFSIVELPSLNHLFQTCTTGSIEEYAQIEETISPTVLKLIGDWILERTK